MIWYLLYPFRGTTEAPVLAPSHPLRHGLTRYGSYAASHVVTTLLISVAVVTILVYPIPFLFTTDFINGASGLPHHAWTAAQPLPYRAITHPDVMMRSIWVHGSYMQALNKTLLTSALELQDELLGPTVDFNPSRSRHAAPLSSDASIDLSPVQRDAYHAINGLTNESWFFHSPLQYWGCSSHSILDDPDVLSTVNDRKNLSTSVNVTLRHSIVFSGKRFQERRLIAADALVITLVYLRDSPVGRQWDRKATALPAKVAHMWDIYPPDGRTLASQLYEFQFRPISTQDAIVLALAYCLSALYFLMSLSKLRAFKSKFGLTVTVVAQIAFSIMSSFTICAVFRIDLSQIPRVAYPLVVLSMSLENIFRLINAVILTQSEDNTSNRIGCAFGETAYTAITSSLQNVSILLALARWVSPGVSAFCHFAAIAIVFDLFYLSTFFLSVLSVDVRRTELSDALAKASMRHNNSSSDTKPKSTWDLMLQRKMAMSTRIAGTIVMLGFVLIAQWHFFEDESLFQFLRRMIRSSDNPEATVAPRTYLDDIHQARSPKSWLRLQDHETAQEIISVIKPSAHSYVARVFEPLIFVMKGSDRMPHYKEPTLLPAAYDFINHQLTRFIVIVIVVLAAVRLLTSYLLWEDESDDEDHHHNEDATPLLSVKSYAGGHSLDVAMMISSLDGHVISVGLDRTICIWDMRPGGHSYLISRGKEPQEVQFPVLALAVDEDSIWLAILSTSKVTLWNLKDRAWGQAFPVDLDSQKPEALFFVPLEASENRAAIPSLAVVLRNGKLIEMDLEEGGANGMSICRSPLACVRPVIKYEKGPEECPLALITSSRRGCVHVATRASKQWSTRDIKMKELGNDIHQVVPLTTLGLFLIAETSRVHVMGMKGDKLIHTIPTETMSQRSVQVSYSSRPYSSTGWNELAWLTICYTKADGGECIIQTILPEDAKDLIWARSSIVPKDGDWCSWESTKTVTKRMEKPGNWVLLSDGSVLGIRQRHAKRRSSNHEGRYSTDGLRHRSPRKVAGRDVFGHWEMWTIHEGGNTAVDEVRPLVMDNEGAGHLIVSELGPLAPLGHRSAVFGFGAVVKLVSVGGQERFEDMGVEYEMKRDTQRKGNRRRKMMGLSLGRGGRWR